MFTKDSLSFLISCLLHGKKKITVTVFNIFFPVPNRLFCIAIREKYWLNWWANIFSFHVSLTLVYKCFIIFTLLNLEFVFWILHIWTQKCNANLYHKFNGKEVSHYIELLGVSIVAHLVNHPPAVPACHMGARF